MKNMFFLRFIFLTLPFSLLPPFTFFAQANCTKILGGNQVVDGTPDFLAYLDNLYEQKIINENMLLQFEDSLKNGLIKNPISEKMALVQSSSYVHRKELQKYLTATHLNTQKILSWVEGTLAENEKIKVKQAEVRADTESVFPKMVFHPIPAGSFTVPGQKKQLVTITLTHAFEMMSTPVTQQQWVQLMHQNPSKNFEGEDSIELLAGNSIIQLKPNYPVEKITWREAIEFANRKSIAEKLEPAYRFTNTSEIVINAPDGDIYQAQGYRLPTSLEMEYVLRNLGQNDRIFLANDHEEQKKYAWFNSSADWRLVPELQTHPVATLLPIFINHHPFYDLFGNVAEWTEDFYEFEISAGVNPVASIRGNYAATFGGHYQAISERVSASPSQEPKGNSSQNVGFRLVRTIP